jgi:hypothetical protein
MINEVDLKPIDTVMISCLLGPIQHLVEGMTGYFKKPVVIRAQSIIDGEAAGWVEKEVGGAGS